MKYDNFVVIFLVVCILAIYWTTHPREQLPQQPCPEVWTQDASGKLIPMPPKPTQEELEADTARKYHLNPPLQ